MIRVARLLSVIGVVGYVLIASFLIPSWHAMVEAQSALGLPLNVLIGLGVLASFIAWGMALYHWATTYHGLGRQRWGFALIVGAFIGAWVFWLGPAHRNGEALSA